MTQKQLALTIQRRIAAIKKGPWRSMPHAVVAVKTYESVHRLVSRLDSGSSSK